MHDVIYGRPLIKLFQFEAVFYVYGNNFFAQRAIKAFKMANILSMSQGLSKILPILQKQLFSPVPFQRKIITLMKLTPGKTGFNSLIVRLFFSFVD